MSSVERRLAALEARLAQTAQARRSQEREFAEWATREAFAGLSDDDLDSFEELFDRPELASEEEVFLGELLEADWLTTQERRAIERFADILEELEEAHPF